MLKAYLKDWWLLLIICNKKLSSITEFYIFFV